MADVEPRARDIASVGSRISWGALLAGAVVALTVYVCLGLFGAAVGLTASDNANLDEISTGAAIWAVLSLAIALFLGGFITSRSTVGENRKEALVYGLLVWGVLFVSLMHFVSSGMDVGLQLMRRPAMFMQMDAPYSNEVLQQAGLTDEQIQRVRDTLEKQGALPNQQQDEENRDVATRAAWWSLGAILLSIIAAMAGSLLGAGPEVFRGMITHRRTV